MSLPEAVDFFISIFIIQELFSAAQDEVTRRMKSHHGPER